MWNVIIKRRDFLKLREIRKEKGLSVPALSRLSEVPVRTIEDIEKRGDCKVFTAKKLAVALEVTLDQLCSD
jgi:transcriptional regulator with XRE-family HTH domain